MDSAESIFRNKIPKIWDDYEPRQSQITMSSKIQNAFLEGGSLLAEAGTGVGKSLSYLVPAALFAMEREQTIVISTETKALQDQLIKKDIPILREILGSELRAEIAMGASNYICKRKYQMVSETGNFGTESNRSIEEFQKWLSTTDTGIKSEFQGNISYDLWSKVTRESDNCLGKSCKNFSSSFYFLEKEKWKKAHLLIVNHSLLASHIAGDFRILPHFERLIIDEAHNFPEIVGKSFRSEVTYDGLQKLFGFIHSKDNKHGLAARMGSPSNLLKFNDAARDSSIRLYSSIAQDIGLNFYGATRIKSKLKLDGGEFEKSLKEMINFLVEQSRNYKKDSENPVDKEIALGIEMVLGRLSSFSSFFYELRNRENENLVFWYEPPSYKDKEKFVKLLSEPINVDEIIADVLMPRLESVIFTSATMTTLKGSFNYFEKQIGFDHSDKIQLPSPFDYSKQAILFTPRDIRDPAADDNGYHIDIAEYILSLIKLTQGNCFVLFTSNKSLNRIRELIESRSEYPIFSQTDLGAVGAKQQFLGTDNSVLFGVSSFWQGVDIKGDRLKSVIITRLPFQVPSEPVLETKIERMKEQNLNPFAEIQLPRASLLLKQGFGRLIRSMSDTGIVSILDPRLHTKSYGKQLLSSLPSGLRACYEEKDLLEKFENLPTNKVG
ncbi:ATP-dependent DNA helicase [Leptospira sp. GIMC2001]|uniref:ATP-dependent DNA helicase n=1 Tax=Leptospira sp. GIMC2001 TaxID=1513297 RepID=UPI002348F034|nr:helicase C-terminal domain-containing protein [Leptospira sp. GIMC2001]WCL48020.1 helicase [Leptospira sp. GIMC2001]